MGQRGMHWNRALLALCISLGGASLWPPRSSAAQGWEYPLPYRLWLEIDSGECNHADRVATVELSFADLLKMAGSGRPFAPECLRVVELGPRGETLDGAVAFQFDPHPGLQAETPGAGVLAWRVSARPGAPGPRRYHVYFADRSQACDPARVEPLVRVEDAGEYRGDRAWRISTPAATYYYHRKGSGFASLIDRENNDWISYYPEGGPKGNYRGIPNIAPAGFHPGPGEGNKESRIVFSGPLRVRILSETLDEKWGIYWDIFPWHATMRLFKKGPEPYWILYEGTPGGQFDLEDYWVDSSGRRYAMPPYEGVKSAWHGDLPDPEWVFFGDPRLERVLFLFLHEKETAMDEFWHFGEGGMTVFGFGRGPKEGGWQRLQRVPAEFSFGFLETTDFPRIAAAVPCVVPPEVRVGSPERRR